MANKWTKKQLAALQRIVDREAFQNIQKKSDDIAGIHPTTEDSKGEKRFSISDGRLVILFNGDNKPDGFSDGKPIELLGKFIDEYNGKADSILVSSPLPIDEWKTLAKEWKKGGYLDADFPRVEISAVEPGTYYTHGRTICGWFNAQYILDAVESMGAGALLYLGYDNTHSSKYPYLTVYPKDYPTYGDTSRSAFLLPCRPRE